MATACTIVTTSSAAAGRSDTTRTARMAPTRPRPAKPSPSVCIDGRVTAPELPTIATLAVCVNACSSANIAGGAHATNIARTRTASGEPAARIATAAATVAGAIHTGHDSTTPTALIAVSHSHRRSDVLAQAT